MRSSAARVITFGLLGVTCAMRSTGAKVDAQFRYSTNRPDAIVAARITEPMVALTFDDGPDPRYTPLVLQLLARYGAHATFFDVGRHVLSYPDLARAEVRAGNEVANHTFDHYNLPGRPAAAVFGEIQSTADVLRASGVPEAHWFRPPRGEFDRDNARVVRAAGYRTVMWLLAVEHFVKHRPVSPEVDYLLSHVVPGTIILAHDAGGDRSITMESIPLLLEGLRARGFRVVTVGTLFDEAAREAQARADVAQP